MVVRLTHRASPALQSYVIQAFGGSYAYTGQASSTLKQWKMFVPDKIQYTLTGQAATLVEGPSWNSSTINVTFTEFVGGSNDLKTQISNYDTDDYDITFDFTMPSGVTYDTDGVLTYDGFGFADSASGTGTIVDSAEADWIARSTAAGVIYADRLQTTLTTSTNTARPASNVAHIWADGTESHVTLDTTIKVNGAAASQRIAVLNTDGSNSGSIRVYWGGAGGVNDIGNGETVWVSFRVRQPAAHAYQPWLPSVSSAHKLAINSAYMGSNQANEIVFQQNYQAGQIDGYRRRQSGSGSDFDAFAVSYSSAANASDVRSQASVDRGANRLTGVNPDDGSSWGTDTWAQQRAQYGSLYSARSSPGAANYRAGFGDPWTGGFRAYHDEWLTLTIRIVVGTFGTDSSRVTAWAARDGQSYTQLWDKTNDSLGNASAPAYNTIWLLPYATSRTAGGRRVTSRTNNITGAEILVCGNSTPVGTGTLTYTASTGRFTWAGNGESSGTARGYSAANDILILNVTSGSASDSFIVVKVTPSSLPAGNASDTVTISDGRADTYINYNDVIVSTQAINAPGGFAPVG